MSEAVARSPFGSLQRNWGWLLALGILLLVLGTVGLGRTFVVTLAGVLFFGWLILLAGVVETIELLQCRGWKSIFWQGLVALLHVVAGIVTIGNPLLASAVLTLLLGASVFAGGLLRIVLAVQHRDHAGWVWVLVGGIAGVLVGSMIASGWPVSSFFVIGLFISIELILHGWTLVAVALAARSARVVDQ